MYQKVSEKILLTVISMIALIGGGCQFSSNDAHKCSADSNIPDLRGTWETTYYAVVHKKQDEHQPKRHIDNDGFVEVKFALVIEKQEGFRFSGFKSSDKRKEQISGVIGFDNKTVYMVDDDGMLQCKLVAPNKMEQIYLHITDHRAVAARAILTRKQSHKKIK